MYLSNKKCFPRQKSRVFMNVESSPNPSSVYNRLCKYRKKVFYICFYIKLQPNSLYRAACFQNFGWVFLFHQSFEWELMQITMQCTRPAWPVKTKLRMTLNCTRIAKQIVMMSGIFVEGRSFEENQPIIARDSSITSNEP